MKTALEFTVTAQLHEHGLIERKTDEIKRLGAGGTGIFNVGHGRMGRLNWVKCRSTHTQNQRALADPRYGLAWDIAKECDESAFPGFFSTHTRGI